MIKAGKAQIAVLEQQLGIFVDEHPSCFGHKSSPYVKGIIIDGVISCDDNMVKKKKTGYSLPCLLKNRK